LAIYKLIKSQWTRGMAIFNAVFQLISSIVFIEILINPEIITQYFITYMTDLLEITANQLKSWIIGGAIFFFMVSAAFNVMDGFRKSRIR